MCPRNARVAKVKVREKFLSRQVRPLYSSSLTEETFLLLYPPLFALCAATATTDSFERDTHIQHYSTYSTYIQARLVNLS